MAVHLGLICRHQRKDIMTVLKAEAMCEACYRRCTSECYVKEEQKMNTVFDDIQNFAFFLHSIIL